MERTWTWGLFSRAHKNVLIPGKMEWARLQELNSKSYEFNSNGLNKDKDLEVSKNVENLGGASINGERIMEKV